MSSRGEIELINLYGELSCDYDNVTLHVPRGSIEAYSTTAPWNKFKNIVAIEDQGIVYNFNYKDKTAEVIKNPNGYSGAIVIPATVMHDGEKYTVTKIGNDSFRNCSELISVSIPNSVKTMGSYAFSESSNLTSVTIGNSLTNIGYAAFWKCNGLVLTTIPNSVTKIDDYAFQDCTGLTSLALPTCLKEIGDNAFRNCSGLTSVAIPEGVVSIGQSAFSECSGLVSLSIPNTVTTISRTAFYGCIGLKSIDFPESVLEIGYGSFQNCTGLTSVSFPEGLYRIGQQAFAYCSGLTSVTIPGNVTTIEKWAFHGCSSLTIVRIRENIRSIGEWAFRNCTGLTDVYCYAPEVPTTCTNAFSGSNISNATLYVLNSSIDAYKTSSPWNQFKNFKSTPLYRLFWAGDLQRYLNSLHDTQDLLSEGIYTRQFLNTDWQAIYVPFSLYYSDWSDNFEVARLSRFCRYDDDKDGETDRQELEAVIMRSSSDVLKANTPYLIRAKKTGTYNFTVNSANQVDERIYSFYYSANDLEMVVTGNYTNRSGLKSARRYRLMGGSLFIPMQDDEVLPPYRWYATIDDVDDTELARIIFVSETTDLDMIRTEQDDGTISNRKVYNLHGRRMNIDKDAKLSSLPKGIYIVNNKKYIVK